ncbi:MAG: hypothetical protein DI528_11200 [Shinella sp.]|nr:MAG: hypothetical protein DI528_11200 [Shinella sp.]
MYEAPEPRARFAGLGDSSGIGPLIGSAAPDYFQPVEQAPSHMRQSFIEGDMTGQTRLRRIVWRMRRRSETTVRSRPDMLPRLAVWCMT